VINFKDITLALETQLKAALDIPRTWAAISGTPTINGDVIQFADENSQVWDPGGNWFTLGKTYIISCTVSDYVGTGNINLPYNGAEFGEIVSGNGIYEYDFSPVGAAQLFIFSASGHTATVTVNYIKLKDKDYLITRNKRQNTEDSVAVAGWIGIYRDGINYQPHSSGATPWMAEPKIRLEIQAASYKGASDCEEKLEAIQEFVMNAIESDRTIGGTVQIITEYDLDYDDNYSDSMQTTYQFITLIITTEVKA
jgi:hypothetical protein